MPGLRAGLDPKGVAVIELAPPRSGSAMPTAPPDYIRVADEIAAKISAGVLKSGDKLASISVLATEYAVSVSTIKSAYIRLEALELIIRRQGKGVFVA
jgi:GntR family transcriptional regulator